MARIDHSYWNSESNPTWAGDFFSRDHLVPGAVLLDVAAFSRADEQDIDLTAVLSVGDTTITVTALTKKIPTGAILRGDNGEYVKLSSAAAVGDTTINIHASLISRLATENLFYEGSDSLFIPSGTVIGRTFTERASGDAFGPCADADEECYVLAFDAWAERGIDFCEGVLYRYGSVVIEDRLPDWSTLSAAVKALLRANYSTIIKQA